MTEAIRPLPEFQHALTCLRDFVQEKKAPWSCKILSRPDCECVLCAFDRIVAEVAHLRSQVQQFQQRLADIEDIDLARLQLPDGSVPGDTVECARGWHAAYYELRAQVQQLHQENRDAPENEGESHHEDVARHRSGGPERSVPVSDGDARQQGRALAGGRLDTDGAGALDGACGATSATRGAGQHVANPARTDGGVPAVPQEVGGPVPARVPPLPFVRYEVVRTSEVHPTTGVHRYRLYGFRENGLRVELDTLYLREHDVALAAADAARQTLQQENQQLKRDIAILSERPLSELRPHAAAPEDCPSWWDGCNCTVEGLSAWQERAFQAERKLEAAEAARARLQKDLDNLTQGRWTQTELDAAKWRAHERAKRFGMALPTNHS